MTISIRGREVSARRRISSRVVAREIFAIFSEIYAGFDCEIRCEFWLEIR